MQVYLIVHPVEVGIEAVMVPPASMRDFSTYVPHVRSAEALLVMVPAEAVLYGAAEATHVEAEVALLIIHAAGRGQKIATAALDYIPLVWGIMGGIWTMQNLRL